MKENGLTISLPPILHLPSPEKDSLHPFALKTYLQFLHEVNEIISPTCLLDREDLVKFLSETECARWTACEDEIKEWLRKCGENLGEFTHNFYAYHSPFDAMWDMRKLLKQVYDGKVRYENRKAALKEINPPMEDAKKYLDEKEYQLFISSLSGAADAYLGCEQERKVIADVWLVNNKAIDYTLLTRTMKRRKEEETRRKQAEKEHDEYLHYMNQTIETFKKHLSKNKKPMIAYPISLSKYQPQLWCDLETPTKAEVEEWAVKDLWPKVPQALTEFASWDIQWQEQIFPYAKYEDLGVPCLTWCFKTEILVEVHLKLKEKTFIKEFHGYQYPMKINANTLGRLYVGPVLWEDEEGFSVPIRLLRLLAEGNLEEPGLEIVSHDSCQTVYAVDGFDDLIELRKEFIGFILDVGNNGVLAEALVNKGLIDETTAKLIEAKWAQPLPDTKYMKKEVQLKSTVSKLVELGWAENDAKKAIEDIDFPPDITAEEIVKIILHNQD